MRDSSGPIDDGVGCGVPTQVLLTSVASGTARERAVDLAAEVRPVVDTAACPPVGTVAFRSGPRLLGTAPVGPEGVARLHGVRLPADAHPVVASYGGDRRHAPATSAPLPPGAPTLPTAG